MANDNRPPRSRWLIASVIVLVLLVLTAVVGAVLRDGTAPATPPAAASTPAAGPAVTSTGTPGCAQVAPPSSRVPTRPPADLRLEVENRALIPVSDTFGPAQRSGRVWTCFAHTPMGAVMAAQTISTRRVASPDRVQVGEQQLVHNRGRAVFLAAVRARSGDLGASPGTFVQPAGFAVVSYTGDTAVVSSASRASDGTLRAATLTVLWTEDTWKLQLLPDGSDTPEVRAIATLEGYILWGL